jgi:hypothetical protein
MTGARDHLSKADTVTIAASETRVPALVEARTLVERFQAMVREKVVVDLDPWIIACLFWRPSPPGPLMRTVSTTGTG